MWAMLVAVVVAVLVAGSVSYARHARTFRRGHRPHSSILVRGATIVCGCALGVIFIAPGILFVKAWREGESPGAPHAIVRVPAGAGGQVECPIHRDLLVLELHRFDYAKGEVEVRPTLCVAIQNKIGFEDAEYMVTRTERLEVGFTALPNETSTRLGSVKLSRVLHDDPLPLEGGPNELSLDGSGAVYPFERLETKGTWFLVMAEGDVVRRGAGIFIDRDLPVEVVQSASQLRWRTSKQYQPFELVGERSGGTRWFVVVIVALPLTLLVGLLMTLGATRRDLGWEVIAAIAAFLIAILPIRAVFVPAEITSLTIVDYALGWIMAMTVVSTLTIVWLSHRAALPR